MQRRGKRERERGEGDTVSQTKTDRQTERRTDRRTDRQKQRQNEHGRKVNLIRQEKKRKIK